jgi:hypothetical protein
LIIKPNASVVYLDSSIRRAISRASCSHEANVGYWFWGSGPLDGEQA